MRATKPRKTTTKKLPSFGEVTTDESSPFESPAEFDGTDYNLEFSQHPPRCSTFHSNSITKTVPEPKTSRRKSKAPVSKKNTNVFKNLQKTNTRLDNIEPTDSHLIPRLPFSRLVREIMFEVSNHVTMITPEALEALQLATEIYVAQRLQDAYLLTLHRGRATLAKKDMEVLNLIKAAM